MTRPEPFEEVAVRPLSAGVDLPVAGPTFLDGHDPDGWMLVPAACDGVRIEGVELLGWSDNDDGIDVVGSTDVEITDCFVRTKDDCIAVEATDVTGEDAPACGERSVRDVRIADSTFWNAEWGNGLEIGYECVAEEIAGVAVENCDVIRVEREGYSSGGVLTIHNGDRARVHDVRYEDVRVEDAREKLIDLKRITAARSLRAPGIRDSTKDTPVPSS